MMRFVLTVGGAVVLSALLTWAIVELLDTAPPTPAKTETLSCVRVKEVAPAGTINYLCEVRK